MRWTPTLLDVAGWFCIVVPKHLFQNLLAHSSCVSFSWWFRLDVSSAASLLHSAMECTDRSADIGYWPSSNMPQNHPMCNRLPWRRQACHSQEFQASLRNSTSRWIHGVHQPVTKYEARPNQPGSNKEIRNQISWNTVFPTSQPKSISENLNSLLPYWPKCTEGS